MTDDDYDALSQKQLASIKRDMRISLEDAAVRATYKVMAELETEQNQGEEHMTPKQEEALAQPEQEPVAYIEHHKAGDNLVWDNPGADSSPLYTSPPPQRTWVRLTDEEVEEIERWVEFKEEGSGRIPMGKLVSYISEKLRNKNT